MNSLFEKYIREEALPEIFCPGCGDGIVLNSFLRAIDKLGIKHKEMALFGGVGCSGWIPVYTNFDVFHTLHGRAFACATGTKAVNPDKTIVCFTGDGDTLAIGGNHFIHAARRNIDITVILLSNYIYGMTGGQKAPTTPFEATTKTSPWGNDEQPFNACKLAVSAGATFYARWTTAHPIQMQAAIEQAITHKGFSVVEVLTQCPTQAGRNIFGTRSPIDMLEWYKNNTYVLKKGDEPDSNNPKTALGTLYVGERLEFTESLARERERSQEA